MYGGAAGGGKSQALVYTAARFADHPQHRAIILRRTRPQSQETIDRTLGVYPDIIPGAKWKESENRWILPAGGIIEMGFSEHEEDIMKYKSFEYNLICFDELTSFTKKMYGFMFMRNRTTARDLPLWIRSGTNPGDVGHEWVYEKFVKNREPFTKYDNYIDLPDGSKRSITQQFIPAFIWDNPAIPDRDAYLAGMIANMSPEEVAAYVYGQWTKLAGAMFKTPVVEANEAKLLSSDYYVVRAIDFGWDDHTAILWLVVYNDPFGVDVVGELYVRETTIDGIARYVLEREKELGLKPVMFSVGSPEMGNVQATSGQTLWSMFSRLGIYGERANVDRVAGWQRVMALIQNKVLRVWPGRAPNLLRTLPTLQRDPKKPNDIRNRPAQEDHAADALRYGVMAIYDSPTSMIQIKPLEDDPNRDYVYDKVVSGITKGQKSIMIPQLGEWS